MDLDKYQDDTATTAIYPHKGEAMGLAYTGLKLSGEAAEVGQLIGKAIRDTDFAETGKLKPEVRQKIAAELGDVLWYAAEIASQINYYLSEVAQLNLEKLQGRKERGTLQGSGDER